MPKKRPKIGIALSGASGRAVAHIGVLEVFRENNIPIDYITACSSATMIAGAYACGTMEELKQEFYHFSGNKFLSMLKFDSTGKGLFSIENFETLFRKYTHGKKLEEVYPRLGFVCADMDAKEVITLQMGDMVRAGKASCSVPGLFEPAQWGNRHLVDAGIYSIVPVKQAYELGADIVIGVDIAARRYMFYKRYIYARRGYNFMKKTPPGLLIRWLYSVFNKVYESSIKVIFYSQSDFLDEDEFKKMPTMLSLLGQSLDIADQTRKEGWVPSCDIMISPNVKHFGRVNFNELHEVYKRGREAAEEAVPEIRKMISDRSKRRKKKVVLEEGRAEI